MDNINIGDKLTIKCYKHNGQFHREWDEAVLLDETEDYIVCGNYKTKVTESNGSTYHTKEPAILYFYKNKWYNVIAQLKTFGLFYYCNIASPYVIEDKTIKYIDYDLDLRVFPGGRFKILDKNEYKYHSEKMNYPEEIKMIIERELSTLIDQKRKGLEGFQKEEIKRYVEKYKEITGKE